MTRAVRLWPLATTLCTLGMLAGCTQFPQLDHTQTAQLEASEYPALVPVEPLLAQATQGRVDPVQTQSNLQGRVSRLRARAARLRGSVLTGAERQRLERGLR